MVLDNWLRCPSTLNKMSVLAAIRSLVRSNEDLATLAIAHVIKGNQRARSALNTWLGVTGDVAWSAQDVHADADNPSGRPDLAGYDGANPVAFIEAKFDAGLTEAQPGLPPPPGTRRPPDDDGPRKAPSLRKR